jgi:hypothetical protein
MTCKKHQSDSNAKVILKRPGHDFSHARQKQKANETSLSQLNSEHWSSGEANRKRGAAWLDQIYKANHASTENTLAAHKDFCKLDIVINPKNPIDRGFLPTTNYSLTPPPSTSTIAWLSTEITYGLYLSDHSILDAVDTELVVLGGIMMQNLPRETGWHLRGTRRIGVSFEDVETVQQCVSFSRHLHMFDLFD